MQMRVASVRCNQGTIIEVKMSKVKVRDELISVTHAFDS